MPKRTAPASALPGLVRRATEDALSTVARAGAEYDEQPSGDALHALRVALRRLTALARLFHGFPGKGDGKELRKLADDLRRALSPSREREVSTSLVHRLSGEDTEPSRAALAALRLDADHAAPDVAPRVARVVASLRSWSEALVAWEPDPDGEARLAKKLTRRLKAARRRVLDVGVPGPRTLHKLRISGKALRYALEIVTGVVPVAADLIKSSKKFQDALGEANDWDALQRTLRQARSAAPRAARATLDRLAPTVEEERERAFDAAQRESRRFIALLGETRIVLAPPVKAPPAAPSRRTASARGRATRKTGAA